MKKKIVIIGLMFGTLVIAGLGCSNNSNSDSQQQATNNQVDSSADIGNLFNDIRNTSGINFSSTQPADFSWIIENRKDVSGQMIEVNNLTNDQEKAIENYFLTNGFSADKFNSVVSSTSTASIGYKKDNTVCSLYGQALGLEDVNASTTLQNVRYNIQIKCGRL